MAKGTLILLRHGQTTWNELRLMCGQHDAPLTDLGEEQARQAGEKLKAYNSDKVYSSSLSRAFNTAALALGSAAGIEKRDDLMECHAGDFTGRSLSDPEILAFPRNRHMSLPNGESEAQFVSRVRDFFQDEIQPRMERGETVLVVSHAGVMHAFDAVMHESGEEERSIWDAKRSLGNAAIVVVDFEEGRIAGEKLLQTNEPPKRNNGGFRPSI